MIKPVLGRVAGRAAAAPIEAITAFFVLVTLVYFQLLHLVEASEFFTVPASYAVAAPSTFFIPETQIPTAFQHKLAKSTIKNSHWTQVSDVDHQVITGDANIESILVQRFVLSAHGPQIEREQLNTRLKASYPEYEDVCYRVSPSLPCVSIPAETTSDDTQVILTFVLQNTQQARGYIEKLEHLQHVTLDLDGKTSLIISQNPASVPTSGLNLQPYSSLSIFTRNTPFDTFAPNAQSSFLHPVKIANNNPAQHIKFLAHAIRALITRFWLLAKKADSADIFVVLLGYVLMHFTFLRLFLNMRKMGSSFWLPSATLISSTFAFLLAIYTAYLLNVPVDLISLSEALPFMVIAVGFDKPFLLARAVFNNPEVAPVRAPVPAVVPDLSGEQIIAKAKAALPIYTNGAAKADKDATPSGNGFANNLDLSALDKELAIHARIQREISAAKDRSIRFAAPVGAKFIVTDGVAKVGLGIVRDYAIEVAVLSLGAISGIGGLKEFCTLAALILTMDCLCLFTFYVAILTVMVEVRRIKIARRLTPSWTNTNAVDASIGKESSVWLNPGEWMNALFGQKGSDLNNRTADLAKKKSPAGKLKLTLIIAFLVLHVANLCTPLARQTALKRHEAPIIPQLSQAGVAWVQSHADQVVPNGNFAIQVLPPIQAVAFSSIPSNDSPDIAGTSEDIRKSSTGMASLDHFMSEWTSLVGDPVLSKWIVVAMFVSIILNGYLLKGIASGSAPGGSTGPVAVAAAAARLVGAGGVWDPTSSKDTLRTRRRWSGGIQLERFSNTRQVDSDSEAETVHARQLEHIKHSEPVTHRTPRRKSVDIPVHLPHPAPNANHDSKSGDVTPRSDSKRAPAKHQGGHLIVNGTPRELEYPTTVITSSEGSPQEIRSSHFGRRSLEECWEIYAGGLGAFDLSDEEVIFLVQKNKIPGYGLEKGLKDLERAVRIRRAVLSRASVTGTLETSELPMANYDYSRIIGACCENVVGYMPIPVGVAGPLTIDGIETHIPMATTEGTLVASTSRGCKALNSGGGVTTVLHRDAMTRGPAVEFPSITEAAAAKQWIDQGDGFHVLKKAFESSSRFAKLQSLKCAMAGRTLYIRFSTTTGDAMGMNMAGKGTNSALEALGDQFPSMKMLALSGNYCTDKKPAAINWIEGRGKSVVAEAVVPGAIVKSVLKTTVKDLVNLNLKKNLIGSAMAGSIGGFNAHASNLLTAIFLACGQDPAQNVESSQCMTLMEAVNNDQDLLITCSMPCIEVGTVGGGTILAPQYSMLEFLGVAGAHPTTPGANAQRLARIICAAVMAGELSLMSALAANQLISAHMRLNRSTAPTGTHTPAVIPHSATMTPLIKSSTLLPPNGH